ncbi:MAG TPA: polysaccharide biosynthesis tyrosine autokinase [Patescibacteria group bacterium]|nr:polysaccharide biosynthesis tyrosine autokinase [Patescibacteria group bacterium]
MSSDQPSSTRHDLPAPVAPLGCRTVDISLSGGELFSLHACRQILRHRRATILSVTVIITVLAACYAFKTKPVYRSTATIEVDADHAPLTQINDPPSPAAAVSDGYLQTQVDILKSQSLAWRTIAQLRLDKRAEFEPRGRASGGATLQNARSRRSRILAAFERQLQVRLAPGSRIVRVSFEDADPDLARRIPNALVDQYLEYNFTANYESTHQVSDWMAKELGGLKKQVVTSQQALVNYEKRNGVADLSNQGNLPQGTLDDLSRELTAAQTELAAKKALYDAVRRNPSAAGLLTRDSLLSSLQGKYGDLATEYAKALAEYGPAFYKVVRIRKQIDEVKLLMNQEQKREQAQVQANYRAASQRVAILSRTVSRQRAEVEKFNELQIPFNILKNDYQTNQHLYESLLQRLKDAEISAGLRATNVHVLDRALYPVSPVRPEKTLDIAAGLLSGLLVGLTLAFVQEGLDTSVKRPEELESVIGAPVLAVIPEAGSLPGGRAWPERRAERRMVERCVLQMPNSPIAEAYRTLRTSLLLASAAGPPQVLLFTSTEPREGKTSTCVNLALSLAQLNRRVLLIDGDLRRGRIQSVLRLPRAAGLSDVLAGGAPPGTVLSQVEEAPNLWVLSSGPRASSPADLLSSPMMEQMIGDFRRRFEFVLIDSPPLLLVADPTILSKFADGIVLVTSSETTTRKAVSRALRILETAGEKLLGAVVNRVDARRGSDYDYYRHHHHYYVQEAACAAAVPDRPGGGQDC